LEAVVARLRDEESLMEVKRLFLDGSDSDWEVPPRSEISIRKGLEAAWTKMEWLRVYGDKINQVLEN
jgi:hypothetical protein